MNPIQFPRIIVLSALLLTLPNLGFARKGVSSSKPQISQTEAPKPYGFMLKREADGSTTADWAEMYSKIQSDLSALNSNPKTRLPMPVKIRIYVDNKLKTEVPIGNNTYTFSLRTDEQYSVRLEAVSANGTVIERTAHNLLEKIKIRSVNPANYSGENTHVIHSPMDKKLGIDPDMPEVVQKIGRSKIVYVWKNPDDPKIASLQGEVDFQLLRDQNGEIKAYTATDKARNEKGLAPFVFKKDAAFVKVDAAFNENAFLWDDSFTCLHVTPFDPELCRQTLEFWLDVQKNHSQGLGDIPREVLKVNGTSYNLYAGVHLGKEIPNGGYNNPNILGDVVENLVDQTGLTAENRKLVERTLISMKSYAKWLDQFRTVKDRDGKLAGYWISDLGSGMDNIGRAPHGYFSATGYVDELARRIELEKSSARLNARLGNWKEMSAHEKKAGELDALLNTRYWSKEKGFYYDLVPGPGGKLVRQEDMPTVAGFWPLFSRSASAQQMKRIATDWYTEKTFGGTFPVRSLPPIMQELRPGSYHPEGGYWRGGNWAPTDIIKALGEERSGRPDLAADTINKKLAADSFVAKEKLAEVGHKTVYETLGTDEKGKPIPGIQVETDGRVHHTRLDFVGWGGTPHTFGKLRNSLGIRPVGAFGGNPKDLDKWISVSTKNPIFANSSHFAQNSLREEIAQKRLFGEGYLEINLPFDPGSEAVEVKNYKYAGEAVDLKIERAEIREGKPVMKVSVTAEAPVELNLAFNQMYNTKTPGVPASSSEIVKVKSTQGGTSVVELVGK